MNRSLFAALKLEKIAMFIILTLIILVAAFGIASTLFMMVMKKTRDIAILKSMGATRQSIMKIFIINGLVIGGLGTDWRLGAGPGALRHPEKIPVHQAAPGCLLYLHPAGDSPIARTCWPSSSPPWPSAFSPPSILPGRRPVWTRWRLSGMNKVF